MGGLIYTDCRSAPLLFSAAAGFFCGLLASAVALALSLSLGLNLLILIICVELSWVCLPSLLFSALRVLSMASAGFCFSKLFNFAWFGLVWYVTVSYRRKWRSSTARGLSGGA